MALRTSRPSRILPSRFSRPLSSKPSRTPSSFRRDEHGNIAMLFGIILIPLMLVAGIAVDYLRVTNLKSKITETLDVTLLMTAKQYAVDNTIDITQVTQDYFNASWNMTGVPAPTIAVQVLPNGNLSGTTTAQIPTTFTNVLGISKMDVGIASQVGASSKNLELALVLDNTHSMVINDRIGTLKTAATDLVNTLVSGTNNNVKISVVPFSNYVNVGMDKDGESWLDVPAPIHYPNCYYPLIHPELCTPAVPGTQGTPYPCSNPEGVPRTCYSGGTPGTPRSCPPSAYSPTRTCNPYDRKWTGCVGSRNNPMDMKDVGYGNRVPGLITGYCPNPVTALTSDKDTITAALNNMAAKSNHRTYIPGGLMWGWRTLSSNAPFAEGVDYTDTKVEKVIVLMTDGTNTLKPSYPSHGTSSDPTVANSLTATACINIKARGIKIYTIAFEVTDTTTQTLLQQCASSAEHFYNATDAASLVTAFKEIRLQLVNLRVAK